MSANGVVQLAAAAGRIILENGGETYRVEETVNRVCKSFGVRNSHTYATPTVLIVSVDNGEEGTHSAMERIATRWVNLDKIDAANRLSRQFEAEHPSLERAWEMVEEVRSRPSRSNRTVLVFSALACACFAVVFQGDGWDVLAAFLAGALVKLVTLQLARIRLNDFFINVLGGAVASLWGSLWVAVGLGGHGDIITISALMLLVPGLIITNAVRDVAAGDLISGISRVMEAFVVAIAIACGTALSYGLLGVMGGGVL